jgi:hypothetical protein
VKARRLAWFEAQPELDPPRLVFIDETGASTKMARLRGRAPRGARCRAAIPHGHWKTTTLVAALRLRTSKFAFAELHERVTRRAAADFLRRLAVAVPYRIHTVLTDNGTHFTEPTGDGWKPADIRRMRAAGEPFRCHSFELACADLDIEHRLTKPNHPWTNGQVERMNRTLKEATVRRYHCETHEALRAHLGIFLDAYNFARRLKTLRGLTPFEFISQIWTSEPHRFRLHPDHLIPGPNI